MQTITLKNGTTLAVNPQEMPSLAPWLLGRFWVELLPDKTSAMEFCCGNGAASFWAADRGIHCPVTLVDFREEVIDLCRYSIDYNRLADWQAVAADVRTYRGKQPVQVILANPPFFCERDDALEPNRKAIRHEGGLTPEELFQAVRGNLREKGHFLLAHTPQRLPELISTLQQGRLEPKVLQFCRHDPSKDPFLVLIDSVFGGGSGGMRVLPDFCVMDETGAYTPAYLDLMGGSTDG